MELEVNFTHDTVNLTAGHIATERCPTKAIIVHNPLGLWSIKANLGKVSINLWSCMAFTRADMLQSPYCIQWLVHKQNSLLLRSGSPLCTKCFHWMDHMWIAQWEHSMYYIENQSNSEYTANERIGWGILFHSYHWRYLWRQTWRKESVIHSGYIYSQGLEYHLWRCWYQY